jgi:short subunit dehydrogenase-like uncharacterized protein
MSLLVYGANGYTGQLVVSALVQGGLQPIVAGRREDVVVSLAHRLGLEHRIFDLDLPKEVESGLDGVKVVLNCAGPFIYTALPLVDACLAARAHYLDITGEVMVFAKVAARDREAREAGVMLLPGAGFDVVPSDCLAAHLHQRLPSATRLRLAFKPSGGVSRGTALTGLEGAAEGGLIRRGGELVKVAAGHRTMEIDFGDGPRKAIAIPWGDVFTAHVTTGIPDIEVYMAARTRVRLAVRAMPVLAPLLARPAVQRLIQRRLNSRPAGPSEEVLRTRSMRLWGEASDGQGRVAVSRMRTPNGYELTRLTAADLAARALAADVRPGFQTPAGAYGADYVLGFPGVTREDVAEVQSPAARSSSSVGQHATS